MTSAPTYTPLPVRRRDLLEVFDTGLKLYRRYFWILLGWSFISSVTNALCQCISIFSMPFIVGASACCIAAAVRGQNVTFSQCWRFLKPRYWATVSQFLLVMILSWVGLFGLWVVLFMVILWGGMAMAAMHMPSSITTLFTVLLFLVMAVAGTVVGSVIMAWTFMTPIIVCLEDDKRGGAAQTRAWDLLRREWMRVTGLYTLIGLASIAVLGITGGFMALLVGLNNIKELLQGTGSDSETMMVFAFTTLLGVVFATFSLPLILLVTGVFYLDLRVRKEALDIEWSAHVTAPPGAQPTPGQAGTAMQPGTEPAGALEPSSMGTRQIPPGPPGMAPGVAWGTENFGSPPPPPAVQPTSGFGATVPPPQAPAAEPGLYAASPQVSGPADPEQNPGFGPTPVDTAVGAQPYLPSGESGFTPPAPAVSPEVTPSAPAAGFSGFAPPPAAPETSSFGGTPSGFAPAPAAPEPSSFGGFSGFAPAPAAPEASSFGGPPSGFAPPPSAPETSSFGSAPSYSPAEEPAGFAPPPFAPESSSFGGGFSGFAPAPEVPRSAPPSAPETSSFGGFSGFAPAPDVPQTEPPPPAEPPVVEWKPSAESIDQPRND